MAAKKRAAKREASTSGEAPSAKVLAKAKANGSKAQRKAIDSAFTLGRMLGRLEGAAG